MGRQEEILTIESAGRMRLPLSPRGRAAVVRKGLEEMAHRYGVDEVDFHGIYNTAVIPSEGGSKTILTVGDWSRGRFAGRGQLVGGARVLDEYMRKMKAERRENGEDIQA
ncbi:MAG TPA: hypothetical protein VFW90_02865 [Candidatus Saccharimonadales bacterium]|nr:hypothetical protein [Candidatus Saccharimonadales bacterium]